MAPRDFLNERRIVVHNGRRFSVSKPTVETILRLTMNFGIELAAIYKSWTGTRGGLGTDPVAVILPFLSKDPSKLAEVLATFTTTNEVHDGEIEDALVASSELCERVVRAALTICDAGRIVREMNLEGISALVEKASNGEDVEEVANVGPSPVEAALAVVAEHYKAAGVTPFDVTRWPYEALITTIDVLLPFLNRDLGGRGEPEDFPPRTTQGRPVTSAWAPGSFGTAYATGTIKKTPSEN